MRKYQNIFFELVKKRQIKLGDFFKFLRFLTISELDRKKDWKIFSKNVGLLRISELYFGALAISRDIWLRLQSWVHDKY